MSFVNEKKQNNAEYWLSVFSMMALFIFGIFPQMAGNNSTYAIEQINNFDTNIFAGNIAGSDGSMSPRFFMNFIVKIIMKINGGDWTKACLCIVFLGAIVLAFAITELAFNLTNKNRLFITAFMGYLTWTSVNANFLRWNTFDISTIGMGTAIAIVMLAFSQVVGIEKKWNYAWIILGLACLFHVHEGMYGFCLLFIVYVTQAFREKKFRWGKEHAAFLFYLAILFICVIPGLFGAKSGLSNAEFVEIYAKYRSPFHLDPEYWEMADILKYVLCIVGTAIFRAISLIFTKKEKLKEFLFEAGITLIAVTLVFLFEEIFVNICPVAAVVTMYLPKFFKYAGFLSQIWTIETVIDWIDYGEYIAAAMSYITVIIASSQGYMRTVAIYFCSIVALIIWKKASVRAMKILYPLMFMGGIIFGPVLGKKLYVLLLIVFIFIIVWERKEKLRRLILNPGVVTVLSVLLLIAGSKGRIWEFKDGSVAAVDAEVYLVNIMGQQMYDFATDFKENTSADEEYLNDFDFNQDHWLQLVSRRNSYAGTKIIPSSVVNIEEWWNRHDETENLFFKSADEIATLMRENGIKYIFVDKENYSVLDSSEEYSVFITSSNDDYRMYQLVDN